MTEDNTDESNKGAGVDKTTPVSNGSFFRQRKQDDKIGAEVKIGDITILIGRPSLQSMIKNKIIPSDIAASATNTRQKMENKRPVTGKELDQYQQYEALILMNSVRSPKIVEREANYENNEVLLDDFSDQEKLEIMMYIQGGAEALRSFRIERQRQVAGLGVPEISKPETE